MKGATMSIKVEMLKGLTKGFLKGGDEKLMTYIDRCKKSEVVQKAEKLAKQVMESPTTQKIKDEYEKVSRKAIAECFRIFDEVGLGKDIEPAKCNCTCGDCKANKESKKKTAKISKTSKKTKKVTNKRSK
jgi:hypothetical protein